MLLEKIKSRREVVMKAVKIKGKIKDYAWGNDYFLPSLLGVEKNGPKAEYWMGTHPSGDAVTENGESLSSYISSDLEGALGKECAASFKGLPLLFKILAIEKPLSLQCHPNKRQAEEGWKRERKLRESGKEYNYQDDNEKAEIIYALTPVSAMCGFRKEEEIDSNYRKYIPLAYERYFNSRIESIEKMFFRLYELEGEERADVLSELAKNLEGDGENSFSGPFLTLKGIALECLKEYEGDIGALAPLFMNIVHLNEGEALFLKPDTLHAYVLGNGVELMSASDNVLRGGLTKKRIDLDELKRIMEFNALDVKKVEGIKDSLGRIQMRTPTPSFTLARLDTGRYGISHETGIVIVTDGSAELEEKGHAMVLKKGEAAFIPYSSDVVLTVKGTAFEALVPNVPIED